MTHAFLFDIGNVLVHFDFIHAARAILPLCDAADAGELLQRIDADKLRYEDGQMPRADFLRAAFAALKYRGTEAEFIAAWQCIFSANAPMHQLVERLRGRYPLYLLSNTNDIHIEGLFRDFPVFQHFTGATYSHLARASKPHRAIYEIACRDHALEPSTTLFIDDLAANIATAQALGFQTHHYHPERHDALLDALRDFELG